MNNLAKLLKVWLNVQTIGHLGMVGWDAHQTIQTAMSIFTWSMFFNQLKNDGDGDDEQIIIIHWIIII